MVKMRGFGSSEPPHKPTSIAQFKPGISQAVNPLHWGKTLFCAMTVKGFFPDAGAAFATQVALA